MMSVADADTLRMMVRSRERTVKRGLKAGTLSAESAAVIRAKSAEMLALASGAPQSEGQT